jgi:hypothetical protein
MTFRRHHDADDRVASARKLVKILLDADDLYPAHRKEFIRLALWKVTEAEPASKYSTRYRSLGALQSTNAKLQHEHVYERGKMADALLASPERLDELLSMAVGCVVTAEEHEQLTRVSKQHPHLDGWNRYAQAGITVIDMTTGRPIELT